MRGLLANKFICCLLLWWVDPCKLACRGQERMIGDSTENSCLHFNFPCVEDILHSGLHMSILFHHARRWRAHNYIGLDRPWSSYCGNSGCGSGGWGIDSNGGTLILFYVVCSIPTFPHFHCCRWFRHQWWWWHLQRKWPRQQGRGPHHNQTLTWAKASTWAFLNT